MNHHELARKLARGIFETGDEPHDKVQRVQFMGGKWPSAETQLGGLNEHALTAVIHRLLVTASGEGASQ